jgi:hypothetical protein
MNAASLNLLSMFIKDANENDITEQALAQRDRESYRLTVQMAL